MATQPEVSEILAMLAVAYPRFQMSKDTAKVYYQLLRDIPTDELRAAAARCATQLTFFPSVNELRTAVADLRKNISGIPSAYEAWDEVSRRAHTPYKTVDNEGYLVDVVYEWSHPIVQQVAHLMGWPHFPDGETGVDRAHFFKAYEATVSKLVSESVELPEVRAYIDRAKQEQLGAGNQIALLAERLRV